MLLERVLNSNRFRVDLKVISHYLWDNCLLATHFYLAIRIKNIYVLKRLKTCSSMVPKILFLPF